MKRLSTLTEHLPRLPAYFLKGIGLVDIGIRPRFGEMCERQQRIPDIRLHNGPAVDRDLNVLVNLDEIAALCIALFRTDVAADP